MSEVTFEQLADAYIALEARVAALERRLAQRDAHPAAPPASKPSPEQPLAEPPYVPTPAALKPASDRRPGDPGFPPTAAEYLEESRVQELARYDKLPSACSPPVPPR